MSIKTTHYVTRDFAIKAILSKLYTMSENHLEDVLEVAIHNKFYNFAIVPEYTIEAQKEKEFPNPILNDLNNLPPHNDA